MKTVLGHIIFVLAGNGTHVLQISSHGIELVDIIHVNKTADYC